VSAYALQLDEQVIIPRS